MNGDTVSLPFSGTVRRHEWQPAKAEPGRAKAKPEPRADSIEARIMVLLAVTPKGLTALEVRTALQASKDAVASKLSRLVKLNFLFTDGKREKLGPVYKLKQKPASPNGL